MEKVYHTFDPVYDEGSKILIVGTMASVKSRQSGFYYGNPQNRFYDVLSKILNCAKPVTVEEKITMLLKHGIALYDVLESCEIKGSSDASIKNARPHDFSFVKNTAIKKVFANGRAAHTYYKKYIGEEAVYLPSTSPANASYSIERLLSEWSLISEYLAE